MLGIEKSTHELFAFTLAAQLFLSIYFAHCSPKHKNFMNVHKNETSNKKYSDSLQYMNEYIFLYFSLCIEMAKKFIYRK